MHKNKIMVHSSVIHPALHQRFIESVRSNRKGTQYNNSNNDSSFTFVWKSRVPLAKPGSRKHDVSHRRQSTFNLQCTINTNVHGSGIIIGRWWCADSSAQLSTSSASKYIPAARKMHLLLHSVYTLWGRWAGHFSGDTGIALLSLIH